MVEKKSSKVEVKKSSKEEVKKSSKVEEEKIPLESKENRFKRLAESRTKGVLNAIRILGNCSNKTNYEYTQEQVDKIMDTIQESFNTMSDKFTDIKTEIQEFKL